MDGVPNESCLADLRQALCDTAVDVAYLSDHPDHASLQPYDALFHAQPNDERIDRDGHTIATRIPCPSGHTVLWRPGIEDELMPLGLENHSVVGNPEESHRLYNEASAESIQAHAASGGFVSVAHTEGKNLATLQLLVEQGLNGVELFNLHAMFDPTKRREDLGLDPLGWMTDIQPFTSPDGTAEPDLFFLAVLQEQSVSIARWDGLQEERPVVGFAGTDAHQNVLPIELRDGERGDSYRRMLRWFSNHLLVSAREETPSPEAYDDALKAGRLYTAFEILGTPSGVDFHVIDTDGTVIEMGGEGIGQTLIARCPTISTHTPTNGEPPAIQAVIYKDGEPWATECGEHALNEPGVYRMRVDIVPNHLREFLGDTPDDWVQSYPWVYTNPIRVR